jgi:hypothetical protein
MSQTSKLGYSLPHEVTIYYPESLLPYYHMQPPDIEDILPPEKIVFIAYNVGVFESVQKFGNLITSSKITGGMDPVKVAELLEETRAFYDAEMIAQLINGMLEQRASMNLPSSLTIGRVTASQVDYVISQLKAAGISINK